MPDQDQDSAAREDAMGEGNHSPTAMDERAGSELSPLPWGWRPNNGRTIYSFRPGDTVCSPVVQDEEYLTDADAEFIVRACNAHDELVAALRALFDDYKRLADSGDAGNWRLEDLDVGKQALAALDKAEGR